MTPSRVAAVALLVALDARAVATTAVRFTDVTDAALDLRLTSGATPSRTILEVNGGGVALFDYDDDGDLDLFLANGATLEAPERGPGSRLWANRGDGTFEDVTRKVGLDLRRWAMGVAVGDYDGDGCADVYVTCYGPNVLLRNECRREGGPRFVDVTAAAGVGDGRWSTSAAFVDIDGDDDLDLYVANYLAFDTQAPPSRAGVTFLGVNVMAGPAGLTPQPDTLYANLGDGTFRDVTAESGCTPAAPGYGLGVVALDVDGDARQDIFVGNDSTANFLFHNKGQGRFEEIGVVAGVAANYDGGTQATMGIAVGDVDGNGLPDLFTTNFSSDTNTLHVNLDKLWFEDRTSQYGLGLVSRRDLGWGTGFYDFDSDGDEDLFVANGHVYPEAATQPLDTDYEQPPRLYERRGARFELAPDAGAMFARAFSGRSTAFGDLDGDGDVDVVMTTLNGPVRVFRNDSPLRDVVVVEPRIASGNRHALGARVELTCGTTVQRRWIHGGSYQSVDAPLAIFGLGAIPAGEPCGVRVVWPGGARSIHAGVPRNRRLVVRRGVDTVTATALTGREQPP